MLRNVYPTWQRWRGAGTAAFALALLTAGCSGGGTLGGPATTATSTAPPPAAATAPPPTPSLGDKIESFFSKTATTEAHPTTADQTVTDADCPLMDIRQGASTLTIPPPPPDGTNEAMSLKYQGIFIRAARDCKVVSGQMVMRVGVEGRIIVGPAGGPGEVDVPLRLAVVNAAPGNERTVVTKLINIPVVLGPSDGSKSFTHVEQGLAFPVPRPAEIDNYVVYIGFDPIGAEQQEKAKQKPEPRVKPRPKSNPNTPTG